MSNNLELYEKLNSGNSLLENNWESEFKSGFLIMGIAKEKDLNPEQCFDKIVYSIKLLYNENNGFQELLSKIHFNLKSRRYYYVKFLL